MVPPTPTTALKHRHRRRKLGGSNAIDFRRRATVATSASSSSLFLASDDNKNEGTNAQNYLSDAQNRGYVLQGFVLLVCLWFFSIPPEFRRQPICSQETYDYYVSRDGSTNCVTSDMWTNEIKDYYANGGGIQFDFSIDPATVEKNKEAMGSLFGGGGGK